MILACTACLLAALPGLCRAQLFSLGLKGGACISSVVGSDAGSPQTNMGLAGGACATLGLLPWVAIQPEVLYVQKGWKESAEILGTTVEGDFRINYLEVPVLAKFSFGAVIKPYLAIGPYLATRLGTSAKFSAGGVTVEGNLDELVKKSDAGMVIGAGVQTPVRLSFEARYSYGFGSIDDSGEGLDVKNSALSVLVGYSLF
jgi:hypothetical protein